MTQAIKKTVRALVVTDSEDGGLRLPVTLRFEPDAADAADGTARIRLSFAPAGGTSAGAEQDWVFPRELLESGMRAPSENGEFSVWPCGRAQAVVEYHRGHRVTMVQFDLAGLIRFLRLTYPQVTPVLR